MQPPFTSGRRKTLPKARLPRNRAYPNEGGREREKKNRSEGERNQNQPPTRGGGGRGGGGFLRREMATKPKNSFIERGESCVERDPPPNSDPPRAEPQRGTPPPKPKEAPQKRGGWKPRGFTDPAMRNWTFEHDNGRNPQTETARFYVESWETMQAENIGYLFWGGVGTGKSYLAACIANALMEERGCLCVCHSVPTNPPLLPPLCGGGGQFLPPSSPPPLVFLVFLVGSEEQNTGWNRFTA